MTSKHRATAIAAFVTYLVCILNLHAAWAEPARQIDPPEAGSLWAHDNLVAWEAAPSDSMKRTPEERALMLKRLGFQHYAYLSSTDPWDSKNDVNISQYDVDAEIEAMQKHGIDVLAWYFWVNADDPTEVPKVRATLESFKRHNIHPQIWVTHSYADFPRDYLKSYAKFLPRGFVMPKTGEEYERLSEREKQAVQKASSQALAEIDGPSFPRTAQEQKERVRKEAERIYAFVKLASPYGCQVDIYNHRSWFGIMDNQLAIIDHLRKMGVENVGIVYNFSHSRDLFHDDSKAFPQLWGKIKPHVVAVNVAGLSGDQIVYPSQGHSELAMMRTIQNSGWKGPIGVFAHKTGDMEETLRKDLIGIDWIASELKQSGSGGPRPSLETSGP